jgi:hypothetical protein
VRGGFGVFYFTQGLFGSLQPGYFQTTPLVATLNSFLTPAATLNNPFSHRHSAAGGNSLGRDTFSRPGSRFL